VDRDENFFARLARTIREKATIQIDIFPAQIRGVMEARPGIKTRQDRAVPVALAGAQEFSYLLKREMVPNRS
jgi:hypothetical protein